jgi:hypothetical protein
MVTGMMTMTVTMTMTSMSLSKARTCTPKFRVFTRYKVDYKLKIYHCCITVTGGIPALKGIQIPYDNNGCFHQSELDCERLSAWQNPRFSLIVTS